MIPISNTELVGTQRNMEKGTVVTDRAGIDPGSPIPESNA